MKENRPKSCIVSAELSPFKRQKGYLTVIYEISQL